jgi:2',3'-cyclic-nucleotide 2'-phosphodiesterase (5'-nucleotidase family)
VVLSRLGFGPDEELAATVDGIDVIVGGHTHTKVEQPVVIEKAKPTVIVQANEYLKFLGVLDVSFDDNGVVIAQEGKLFDLNTYTPDPEALAKVKELRVPLDELKKTVVGATSVVHNGERADVRSKETNLGNLITDAMAQKANEMVPETFIEMQNGGGIRAAGQFMQVSGIQFKYDPAKPAGDRVWEVKVLTATGDAVLVLTKTYSVATNAFVADGGDGYAMFKQAKDEGRIHELMIGTMKS